MKRFTWIRRAAPVIMGCLLASSLGAAAEKEHPGKPFLWKIEGKGLEKPSFLFGSNYPPSPEGFHPQVEAAFAGCDILSTDVPTDAEAQQEALPLYSRTDGKTLEEAIGEDLATALSAQFKRVDQRLELGHFKDSKTWMIAWLLPSLEDRLKRVKTMDALLAERASKAGKELRPLMSHEEQAKFFNTLSEDDQVKMIKGQIAKLNKQQELDVNAKLRSLELYRAGEEAPVLELADSDLAEMLNDHPELLLQFRKVLVQDWSVLLSQRIAGNLTALPAKSQFIIIPVGYTVSPQGVRNRLSEAGFQITRINQ